MIQVAGAAGNVGGEFVRALPERREFVRALARAADRSTLTAGAEQVTVVIKDPRRSIRTRPHQAGLPRIGRRA